MPKSKCKIINFTMTSSCMQGEINNIFVIPNEKQYNILTIYIIIYIKTFYVNNTL